jgi:hypothetical protein
MESKLKACNNCGEVKDLSLFIKRPTKSGVGAVCTVCTNTKRKIAREKNGYLHYKTYEKTTKGYLMRCYRNMLSRVKGVQKLKAHLYSGKGILDKEDFYNWALVTEQFMELFSAYTASGFNQGLAPSVDRKDSDKGYTIDNMRWLTHSENSRLGAISKAKKYYGK